MSKDRTAVPRTIDRNMARMIGMVLMGCYRRGVNDAREHRDDPGMLHEHCGQARTGERYGFVGQTARSAVYWRNRIGEIAEERGLIRVYNTLCERMGRIWGNYLSVMLIVAQEMYCRGIEDYLYNPADNLGGFNSGNVKTLWTRQGARRIDNYKLRAIVQDICALRGEREEEGMPDPLKKGQYDIFATAFSYAAVAR